MKLTDKKTWDKVIYGLIYPGFLGSMLYELVPADASKFTLTFFFSTPDNHLRYGILIFCLLDYIHLYGDMDAVIVDPNRKSLTYFLCDFLSSCGYVASFIALKLPNYVVTIVVFGIIPWIFLTYKFKNRADRTFLTRYGVLTSLIVLYRIALSIFESLPYVTDQFLAFSVIGLNIVAYSIYIFKYYEKRSKQIDEQAAAEYQA